VIDLKRDAIPHIVLNQLYKHTQLQSTFGVIMLALVGGVPRVLNLKEMLEHFVEHRHEVVVRRTSSSCARRGARAHPGGAEDRRRQHRRGDRHHPRLRDHRRGGREAAGALRALGTAVGRHPQHAPGEADGAGDRAAGGRAGRGARHHRRPGGHPRQRGAPPEIIKDELQEVADKYGDERRTEILGDAGSFSIEDLIPDEEMVITVSHAGYIKRMPVDTYRMQGARRARDRGDGTKEEDWVEHLFLASTHDYLMFFTRDGQCYWLKVHEIPVGSRKRAASRS
jgi:DNA gyrase subunit A